MTTTWQAVRDGAQVEWVLEIAGLPVRYYSGSTPPPTKSTNLSTWGLQATYTDLPLLSGVGSMSESIEPARGWHDGGSVTVEIATDGAYARSQYDPVGLLSRVGRRSAAAYAQIQTQIPSSGAIVASVDRAWTGTVPGLAHVDRESVIVTAATAVAPYTVTLAAAGRARLGSWPQQHLTDLLGLGRDAPPGLHACGAGYVAVDPASPAALAWRPGGATEVLSRVADTCRALGLTWQTGSALALRRGPYVVAAGVAEATAATPAPTAILEGRFADLFSPRLEVRRRVAVEPGARLLLRDLDWSGGEGDDCEAAVVAAAGRVRDERAGEGELSFVLEGMSDTEAAVRVALPARSGTAGPVEAVGQSVADGSSVPLRTEVDEDSGTALIGFAHQPGGVAVQVTWPRP